jgi:hypothetical protein
MVDSSGRRLQRRRRMKKANSRKGKINNGKRK